jgi:hypothetical protein
MELEITFVTVTYAQMLGLLFKSTRNALIVHFYVTMFFLATSGALVNLVNGEGNAVLSKLGEFSMFRFSTEWFTR